MKTWEKLLAAIVGTANLVGSVGILFLMVVITADVLCRSLLNQPITGVAEMVRFVIVSVVFLQGAYALSSGRFTRSELLLSKVEPRKPLLHRAMLFLFDLAGLVVFALAAWSVWPAIEKSIAREEFYGVQGVFVLPVWPMKTMVFVGAVLIALQYLTMAAKRAFGGDMQQ